MPAGSSYVKGVMMRGAHARASSDSVHFAVASRRGFPGRFRCAASVVVRKAPGDTPHVMDPDASDADALCTDTDAAAREHRHDTVPACCDSGRECSHSPLLFTNTDDDVRKGAHTSQPSSYAESSNHRTSRGKHEDCAPLSTTLTRGHADNDGRLRRKYRSNSLPSSVAGSARSRSGRLLCCGASRAASTTSSPNVSVGRRRALSSVGSARGRSAPLLSVDKVGQMSRGRVSECHSMVELTHAGLHTSLWVATHEGTIEVRSIADFKQVLAVLPARGAANTVVTTITQVGGNGVAAGFSNGTLCLFDAATLTEVVVGGVAAHTMAITCTALASVVASVVSDGEHSEDVHGYPRAGVLLTGSLDGTIGKWDALTLAPLGRLVTGDRKGISALATIAGGWYVCSGSEDGVLRMWNLLDNTQVMALSSGGAASSDRDQAHMRESPSQSHHRPHSLPVSARLATLSRASADAGSRNPIRIGERGAIEANRGMASGRNPRTAGRDGNVEISARPARPLLGTSNTGSSVTPAVAAAIGTARPIILNRKKPSRSRVTKTESTDWVQSARPVRSSSVPRQLRSGSLRTRAGTDITPLRRAGARVSRDSALPLLTARRRLVTAPSATAATDTTAAAHDGSLRRAAPPSGGVATPLMAAVEHDFTLLEAERADTANPLTVVDSPWRHNGGTGMCYWPVVGVHRECVTSMAAVGSSLLISASRDGTAKVFALPSGALLRTLAVQRKIPLRSVVVDEVLGRVYVGSSDGALAIYDLHALEEGPLAHMESSSMAFAAAYVPTRRCTMRRFYYGSVWVAPDDDDGGGDGGGEMCLGSGDAMDGGGQARWVGHRRGGPRQTATTQKRLCMSVVTQMDQSTPAFGPNGTVLSHLVGEASLRETSLSATCSDLQKRVLRQRDAMRALIDQGTAEQLALEGLRRSGLLLKRQRERVLLQRCYERWSIWAARRGRLTAMTTTVMFLAASRADDLRRRYWMRWRHVTSQHHHDRQIARVLYLQSRTSPRDTGRRSPHWDHASEIGMPAQPRMAFSLQRHRYRQVVQYMAAQANAQVARAAMSSWALYARQCAVQRRQRLAYNRLLLTAAGPNYADLTFATAAISRQSTRAIQSHRANGLAVVCRQVSERELRARYFAQWRRASAWVRDGDADAQWSLVEPLSSTLVRSAELRRRYFFRWVAHARFFGQGTRLEEEKTTLQREWFVLQNAIDTAVSSQQLRQEEAKLESRIAQIEGERADVGAMEAKLRREVHVLQSTEALYTLVTGFRAANLDPSSSATRSGIVSGAGLRESRSGFVSSLRSPAKHNYTPLGGSNPKFLQSNSSSSELDDNANSGTFSSSLSGSTDHHSKAMAVLRALKGTAIHYGRDEKLVAAAHAFALKLPLVPPSCCTPTQAPLPPFAAAADMNASLDSFGAARLTHPRTSSGGSWSVTLTSTSSRTYHNASSPGAAATPRRSAAASMWAVHPQEAIYSSLADAFDGVFHQLHTALAATARETGADLDSCSRGWGGALPLSEPRDGASSSVASTSLGASTDGIGGGCPVMPPLPTPTPLNSGRPRTSGHDMVPPLAGLSREWRSAHTRGHHSLATPPSHSSSLEPLRTAGGSSDGNADDHSITSPRMQNHSFTSSSVRWLEFVPQRTRRDVTALVLKLLAMYDSFTAHSDTPIEAAASFSTRGGSYANALPLSYLCSQRTAKLLVRHGAAILELLNPQLMRQQSQLNSIEAGPFVFVETSSSATTTRGSPTALPSSTASVRAPEKAPDVSVHVKKFTGGFSHGMRGGASNEESLEPRIPPVVRPHLCLSSQLLRCPAESQSFVSGDVSAASSTYEQGGGAAADTSSRSSSRDGSSLSPRDPSHCRASPHPAGQPAGQLSGNNNSVESLPLPMSQYAHSGVSTPRSSLALTPRTSATPRGSGRKPYLGFRVNVSRDPLTRRSVISVKEIAGTYLSADNVEMEGPASAAGMRVGDQLERFAGYAVTDLAAFNAIISRHVRAGAELPLVVIRGMERMNLTIHVGIRSG